MSDIIYVLPLTLQILTPEAVHLVMNLAKPVLKWLNCAHHAPAIHITYLKGNALLTALNMAIKMFLTMDLLIKPSKPVFLAILPA